MSGTNPSKRLNDNNNEESAKRLKEELEEIDRRYESRFQSQGDDNRGRSQTRSSGGRGGSRGGRFQRNENVQDDTQSLVPTPTPGGTLGFGIFGASPLLPQTAISMSDSSLLNRATIGRLGNGFIDLSVLGSNDLASVASFTGNGLVPYSATPGLAQRVAQAQDQSILMQHCYQQGLIQGLSNQVPVQPGNQRTHRVSTNPPEKSWSGAPRLPKGSKARAKEPARPSCDRLDLRLKKYTDENGTEKSLINVVTFDGRATNLLSPVQCLNPGVTMGITSLGDRTVLNTAIEIAGKTAEHKDKPHMGHVWYLIGPVLRRPDSARDGPPSARYDRVFLSSSQEDIDLPPKISGIGKDGGINMSGRSDMERVIQERDELIKQRDQAIHDRNALIAIFRTGNPYLTHDTDELLDRYANSEIHAKLCEDFTKEWKKNSFLCAAKLEQAPTLDCRHLIMKSSIDDINQVYRDFNAQAAEITANNTSFPPDEKFLDHRMVEHTSSLFKYEVGACPNSSTGSEPAPMSNDGRSIVSTANEASKRKTPLIKMENHVKRE